MTDTRSAQWGRDIVRKEQGIILPLILIFLALGLLLITPTIGHGYTALASTGVTETKAKELHAADAGIEAGIHSLIYGDGTVSDFDLNDCLVSVSVELLDRTTDDGVPVYHIQSIAESSEDSHTTIDARVAAYVFTSLDEHPDVQIGGTNLVGGTIGEDDFVVDENGTITNIGGSFKNEGTIIFCEEVTSLQGNAESTGTMVFCNGLGAFTGSASSEMTLIVNGDLALPSASGKDPALSGSTIVYGDITGSKNAKITGNICADSISDVQLVGSYTINQTCDDIFDYCQFCTAPGDVDILLYRIS